MANNDNPLNQLLVLLQNVRGQANNLSKDVDEKDQREETQADLSKLFSSFADLRNLLSRLEQSDVTKLQEELKQLMTGQETFAEYNRDVSKILMDVHHRTEEHPPTEEKIKENLPGAAKTQNVGSLFDNWRSVLGNIQNWIEKNTTQSSGRQ